MTGICEWCKSPMEVDPHWPHHKFCSVRCRGKSHDKATRDKTIQKRQSMKCPECDEPVKVFVGNRVATSDCCSVQCTKRLWIKKHVSVMGVKPWVTQKKKKPKRKYIDSQCRYCQGQMWISPWHANKLFCEQECRRRYRQALRRFEGLGYGKRKKPTASSELLPCDGER